MNIYSEFNTDNLYFYAKFPMIIIVIITVLLLYYYFLQLSLYQDL